MGMGRGRNPTGTLAWSYVALRSADEDDIEAMRAALDEAKAAMAETLEEAGSFSKTEAGALLEVSQPTLDKWVASGVLPLAQVEGYKRPRVSAQALLALASELRHLRQLGHKRRGLVTEALGRLEARDPRWQEQFDELYRPGLDVSGGDLVSAAPGDDWAPED